jgi:hypothetical protein
MLIVPPEFFSQIISRCIYELKSIKVSADLYFTVYDWFHLTLVLAILDIFSDFLQILGRICEYKHGLYSEKFTGHKGGLFEYFISTSESKLSTSEHVVKKAKVQEAS